MAECNEIIVLNDDNGEHEVAIQILHWKHPVLYPALYALWTLSFTQ